MIDSQAVVSPKITALLCRFLAIHHATPLANSRVPAFIVGETPGRYTRDIFYTVAISTAWVIIISCTSLLIRWRKGSLWFVRRVQKSDGMYLSPHVGSMFALTSILAAMGVGLLLFYEISLWNGKMLPNPLIVETLVWYPVWMGSFCMVWGSAIAALGLSRKTRLERTSVKAAPRPFWISAKIWNLLIILVPFTVSTTIFTTFIIANAGARHFHHLIEKIFEQIEALPRKDQCATGTLVLNPLNDPLAAVIPSLVEMLEVFMNFKSLTRTGFLFWTLATMINFIVWAPCFFIQLTVFKRQAESEKANGHGNRLDMISQSKARAEFHIVPPKHFHRTLDINGLGSGIDSSSSTDSTGHPAATRNVRQSSLRPHSTMHSAYRALLASSIVYTLISAGILCLSIWVVALPDTVLRGGKRRTEFLASLLSLFGIYGLAMNLGILYQAWNSPATDARHQRSTSRSPSRT